MTDINNFDAIKIGLASPEDIRGWSSGEVTKPETINYRSLKPEKEGLFDERIFGPTKDWECYCGKYKRVRYKGIVCERCGVEVTRSKVRRERMGHIELAAPVSHIWFFKGVPSRIGYILDMAPKDLEKVLYFAASIVTWVDEEAREKEHERLAVEVESMIATNTQEKDEMIADLQATLARREAYLIEGDQSNFADEDYLWADGLENPSAKMSDGERASLLKTLRKVFKSDIEDTGAYMEESIQRLQNTWDTFQELAVKDIITDEVLFRELMDHFGSEGGFGVFLKGGMGATVVRDLLGDLNLEAEHTELEATIRESKGQKQQKAIKRLKVVSAFVHSENSPTWMVLDVVPVIPPDLRPMVQLDGGRFATSDLNDLYRRVINRNNRLKKLLELGAPEIILSNEKRMLQESVDALFDNGRRGAAVTGPGKRPLKSLSDMLKGKQGRFRQNLLGKRVDYSGRSVIVSGPTLKLHQCGLPKLMARELFKPFVMSRLVERRIVENIKAAKRRIDDAADEVIWDILEEVIQEHPVLLNRAPTLHRLGIQAFEPILVEGKAIQVHPLVCHAFNADFDGDQMAVHVPLSPEAQAEARLLMLSSNNILSPAHGQPLATPSQDIVLGVHYLTYGPEGEDLEQDISKMNPRPRTYRDGGAAALDYERGTVKLHELVSYKRPEQAPLLTTVGRIIFNDRVKRALEIAQGDTYQDSGVFLNNSMAKRDLTALVDRLVQTYGAFRLAGVLDELKDIGFQYATQSGTTISKNDVVIPPEKQDILDRVSSEVNDIDEQYEMGLITQQERHELVVNQWNNATKEVSAATQRNLDVLNPIFMMANSGARGSFAQISQLAGMRGLMANPKGETIERPIKSNFMEGLDVLEYFISTHGARKGLADTALRTADSGYLTRRLVDVSQDLVIREEDCGTDEYIEVPLYLDDAPNQNLLGRILAADLATSRGRELAESGQEVGRSLFEELTSSLDESSLVQVRSAMKCQAVSGICQSCYGRAPATGTLAKIGDSVGIIAAQSIGEPGTQLTMRTFHTGGVAGADITHGLPRIVEIFEARQPKGQATISLASGVVSIEENEKGYVVSVTDEEGEVHAHTFPRRTRLFVDEGQTVELGAPLNEGSLDPHELLEVRGRGAAERYLIQEVQLVYKSQGVDIDDKHIEVIARQMFKKLRVDEKGDSEMLPGQLVDREEFAKANQAIKDKKGEQAVAVPILLGITKASLATESFLSAASFQETTKVLTEAAIEGKIDHLEGLKENVIIGKLIPAATGLKRYRRLQSRPVGKVPVPDGLLEMGIDIEEYDPTQFEASPSIEDIFKAEE